ncbi:hypothetical protein ACHAXT_000634 [Thalassiosira profunda]
MSTVTTFDVGVTTLTDVDAISRIAFDVRDMASSLEQNDFLNARRIYEEGKNSPQYDIYGNEQDEFLSLQRMAGKGNQGMFNEDPTYMFQVLGMGDIGQSIEDTIARHGAYADNYITELLNDEDTGTLGAQASTILIVSMYATHMLWDGMLDCFAVKNGYNPDADTTGRINPKKKFDDFIALYIGAGQTLAPDWDGDMLYELAQAGGDLFDTTDTEGEASVNSDVKQLYQSIQRTLSEENYCTRDDSIKMLWQLVNQIIARMYVPRVQMLIHSMKQEDQAHKVKVYALSIIPQLSQCRPSVHRKLKDYLLDKEYDRSDFERILALLQESYDCLGFSCEDVGAYKTDVVAECAGYDEDHPLASFVPKNDVRHLSKVDLDILAVDQLLKFPSTTKNQMAQLYYQYGKAVVTDDSSSSYNLMSLQDMSESVNDGQWSPYYNDYVEYYQTPKFSDAAIMTAFDDEEGALDLHPDQREAYIVSLMRYNLIPEYMMGILGLALQTCRDEGNKESPVKIWDAFAALYIGSLEGIKDGGSIDDDGVLMWSLANNRARQFNTETEGFQAVINDEMTDLLFAGQAELERRDCANFEKTFSRVLHLMLLPLIQSTIWYAIRNEDKGAGSTHEDVAIGEAVAFSVLPIVSKYDQNAAAVIERNMVRSQGVAPVAEGPQAVANAFYQILDDIGWGCDYVGRAEEIDACEQYDPADFAAKSSGSLSFKSGIVTLAVAVTIMWGIYP